MDGPPSKNVRKQQKITKSSEKYVKVVFFRVTQLLNLIKQRNIFLISMKRLMFQYDFGHVVGTAGTYKAQSGTTIFTHFSQHLQQYFTNNSLHVDFYHLFLVYQCCENKFSLHKRK